jgi:CRISPR-associated endonuclease/helicase Cas3
MLVTFVSQCEKKALNRSRRVLDAFANRIGNRTWQTVITNEGLNAVKKLLRKTASKNTAVACHRMRSRSRFELIWIVGNRNKFNDQGIVPVNSTRMTIMNTQWENDWHYLPVIKAIVALSALFHDWGKASLRFQNKLRPQNPNKFSGDPLRHEWVSCLLFSAFVNDEAGDVNDEAWLSRLAKGEIDESRLKKAAAENNQNPLAELPAAASLISWLILSHHRLPSIIDKNERKQWRGEPAESIPQMLKRIAQKWGYENRRDEKQYQIQLRDCLEFPDGLPCQSKPWLKQAKKWAAKAESCLPLMRKAIKDGSWRVVAHHARLCLMLADHFYSSQGPDAKWSSDLILSANTDRRSGKLKQKLDEHLVGVQKNALQNAHLLPLFENEPPAIYDVKSLKRRSPPGFTWQDKAVDKIKNWHQQMPETHRGYPYGFFVVNMASTGCGKTFANAKVMRALSKDGDALRYVLSLGLRTLTLQTGDEYRERIGLDETELAVLIGSRAVMDLHAQHSALQPESENEMNEKSGSESLEAFLDEEISYECDIPETGLATVLTRERDRKFLYAPVLACTIDHMMAATETKRGGRYILPSLRLMSSDLVIDEVDDFGGSDLIAIGRLIHLAGMLGRKVMLSSATISPDLAEGYFSVYLEGWRLYSRTRNASATIGCAWIDEFNTQVGSIDHAASVQARVAYQRLHGSFIDKRIKKLRSQPVKRKGEIIGCDGLYPDWSDDGKGINEQTKEQLYFKIMKQAAFTKHLQHNTIDPKTQKHVSFGVMRVAHIDTCISLAENLMQTQWPEEFDAKIMAYHSRQVLLLRSVQETHLDQVLKRKEKEGQEPAAFSNPVIRRHLDCSKAKHISFILVATPVEEIGRDHDFDWTVVEPSSFRSIIQLAGRILRHRSGSPNYPNVALMQYNLCAIQKGMKAPAYCRPGYEDENRFRLNTHDLRLLIDEKVIAQSIDAIPRIKRSDPSKEHERLADLEHCAIAHLLTNYEQAGPESMEGWLSQNWWLTAMPQSMSQFRESDPSIKLHLVFQDDKVVFMERDKKGEFLSVEHLYNIKHREDTDEMVNYRLWLERDYRSLLEQCEDQQGLSMRAASLRYGEIGLPDYGISQKQYLYSDQFGLQKIKK